MFRRFAEINLSFPVHVRTDSIEMRADGSSAAADYRLVCIASYPRSGNTWLVNCLKIIGNGVRAEAFPDLSEYPFTYRSTSGSFLLKAQEQLDPNRRVILKTHQDHLEFRRADGPHVPTIYVLRDPRDVLLSFYFYRQAFTRGTYKILILDESGAFSAESENQVSFDEREFTEFLVEQIPLWRSHVNGWMADPGVLIIRYEDLKTNFRGTLRRINRMTGMRDSGGIDRAETKYVTQFQANFRQDNRSFYRRGIIGDWRNFYQPIHVRLFEEQLADMMTKLRYPL